MSARRLAEERGLALHREVAESLRRDPSRLEEPLARVRRWRAGDSAHPVYAQAWERLLSGPFEDLLAALVDGSESARSLRQSTPFAGIVDPRTRRRIWREVRARMEAG